MPPAAIGALRRLEGTLDEKRMIHLNMEAERTKNYTFAANLYFEAAEIRRTLWVNPFRTSLCAGRSPSRAGRIFAVALRDHRNAAWHRRQPRWSNWPGILGFASIVQTIPALALLALLVPVPFFGISVRTAITALFLYGLLPIVRNTASGLQDIPRSLRESAIALGLSPFTRLWEIYLPMASRSILSGIKTSAVINVGTATLAALIGAGGLGEPILSGLNLNDHAQF